MSLVNEVLRDLDERQSRENDVRMARTRGEVHLTSSERKNPWMGWVAGGALGAFIALGVVWVVAPDRSSSEAVAGNYDSQSILNQNASLVDKQSQQVPTSLKQVQPSPVISEGSVPKQKSVSQVVEPQAQLLRQAQVELSEIDRAVLSNIEPIKTLAQSTDDVAPLPQLAEIGLSVSETRNSLTLNLNHVNNPPEVSQQPLQLGINLSESKWKQSQTLLTMKYWPNITLISSSDREALLILPLEKSQVTVQTLRRTETSWMVKLNKSSEVGQPKMVDSTVTTSAAEKTSVEKIVQEKIELRNETENQQSPPKMKLTPRALPLSIRDKQFVGEIRRQLRAGHTDQSIENIKAFVAKEPKAVKSSALLLDVYLSSGLQVEALEWLSNDIALSDAQKAYYHSRLLTQDKKWQAALALLNKHRPELHNYPDYYRFKAGVAQKAMAYEQSAKIYGQLLAFESRGSYWLGLGVNLDALNDKTGALNAFKQAQRFSSFTPEVKTYINQRISALSR